jgi:phosphate transport system substrate-binding protein
MKSKWLAALICLAGLLAFSGPTMAGENIVIKGSTTVLPIGQKAAEIFMKAHPDVNISVSGGGSGNGVKAIIDGSCDVAMASRFVKGKEIVLACEKQVHLVPHRVAVDCIVPVVHPGNPLQDITLEMLKSIYTGKVTNWKALGGDDKPIVVISRDTSSGTYEVWHKKVLEKERVMPGALLQASNGAVAQAVAKNPYAIGYVGIGYLNKDLKGLKVNSVEASAASAMDGSYPISRALFMFTNGWPKGVVMSFLNYILSPEGQKMVEEEGFVPLY